VVPDRARVDRVVPVAPALALLRAQVPVRGVRARVPAARAALLRVPRPALAVRPVLAPEVLPVRAVLRAVAPADLRAAAPWVTAVSRWSRPSTGSRSSRRIPPAAS